MITIATDLAFIEQTQRIILQPNTRVELHWRKLAIEMRMADLIVLNQALQQSTTITDAATIWLNRDPIYLTATDLAQFRQLVGDATASLPRKTVRWADLQVTVEPHDAVYFAGYSRTSLN